jgi:uncharacterized protein YgiB involved in biofilm formation
MNSITPIRRRKRSTTMTLTTAMAATGLVLSACEEPAPAPRQEPVEAVAYMDLNQCKVANEVPDEECDKAFAAANADHDKAAPRYEERASCEEVYGPGNCVPRGYNNGGGSFFTPLLTGFVIGRMLDSGGRPYYGGTGLYRDYRGDYVTGYGGRLDRDYATGKTVVSRSGIEPSPAVRSAPAKVQSRTAAVSRGGFGGRTSGHYGG